MGNEDWSLERPNLPQMDLVSHSLQSLKHYPIRAFEKQTKPLKRQISVSCQSI